MRSFFSVSIMAKSGQNDQIGKEVFVDQGQKASSAGQSVDFIYELTLFLGAV
jgi:hypothetical protein